MEIDEVRELTLQALKNMQENLASSRTSEAQFLQDLNTGSVLHRVALLAADAGLWEPPQPIAEPFRGAAGQMLDPRDQSAIRGVLWQLVGTGVLTPRSMLDDMNQFFELTGYGVEVLQEQEPSPYDPMGFMRRLRSEAPNLEPDTLEYMQEAVATFLGRHYRASAVMTGLASESEILRLIELYYGTLQEPAKSRFVQRINQDRNLKQKFDRLFNQLNQDRTALPAQIRELETWLAGTFQVIRLTRNDAGHPSGQRPAREAVYANLNLFLTYARYVSTLKEHLSANAASGQ